jgi:hypothetical protein
MEKIEMTKVKVLSAALIAAAMLAAPAMAREGHRTSRHVTERTSTSTAPDESYVDGRICIPAPRVGAFATAPWTGDNIPCEPQAY